MKFTILAIAALLLMGAVFTGCSDDLWFQNNNEGASESQTYTMTVQASMCSESTRALSYDNSNSTVLFLAQPKYPPMAADKSAMVALYAWCAILIKKKSRSPKRRTRFFYVNCYFIVL